jgi:hypothetical protein
MIIVLGLIILIAAVVAGLSGVLSNGGSGHAVTHFAVFGYHVTGSTGTLFLYGIVLGAVGLFGLSLLLAGARRTSRRASTARRGLKQSRRETAAAAQQRDDLIDQRETARAQTASAQENGAQENGAQENGAQENGAPGGNGHPSPDDDRERGWRHLFGQRSAPGEAAATPAESQAGQPAADIPAGTPADDSVPVSQP